MVSFFFHDLFAMFTAHVNEPVMQWFSLNSVHFFACVTNDMIFHVIWNSRFKDKSASMVLLFFAFQKEEYLLG